MSELDFRAAATRATLVGMAGNIILTAFKCAAGIIAHSSAMLSDAAHSASDIVSGMIVIAGVRLSSKAPDESHPYGHERFECVAAIILAAILAAVGGTIGIGAVRSVASGAYLDMVLPGRLALIAAVVSIAVKEAMFQFTRYHAKRLHSSALAAEAWHHRSDALSSIGALIGIGGARLGYPVMEPIASAIICVFILKAAIDIFSDAVNRMVDHSCSDEQEAAIRRTVESVSGVQGVDMLHTRMFGNKIYVDIEIRADGALPLTQAHDIAERVHTSVEQAFPQIKHIMVHVNPVGDQS